MLYPLSYEGKRLGNARDTALSSLLRQVQNIARCALGPHLGRTITSIHRFCEAIEVIFEQMCVPVESDLRRRMTQHLAKATVGEELDQLGIARHPLFHRISQLGHQLGGQISLIPFARLGYLHCLCWIPTDEAVVDSLSLR